ncbi:DUF6207 family protein [Streptomyces microflavus]|uniref:DUF6207 family protein n=2 Tax=Streptomyces TaxID=1883 RepID=UPI000823C9DF|nr:DUF6207 family protein [Streptomyces sp. ScaeMP-e48]SCK55626.1 hypothetical protein YUYDRAFT_07370 [Streptomyces sp. ScaeMP-e48]
MTEANRVHRRGVGDGMKEIGEQHINEPGLVVLDITAADEDTLRLAVAQLEERWATSGPAPVRRVPGRPGVTCRVYADIRRTGAQGE